MKFSLELNNPPSRSSFCPDDLDAISDLNVWIYQQGVLLPDFSFHTKLSSDGQVPIVFPSLHSSYDIYFLANMGELTGPALEENVGTIAASVENYSSYSQKGFPLAGTFSESTASTAMRSYPSLRLSP